MNDMSVLYLDFMGLEQDFYGFLKFSSQYSQPIYSSITLGIVNLFQYKFRYLEDNVNDIPLLPAVTT